MEPRLITLKLFLEQLNISPKIETVDDRKRVQKAVYLGQRTGVDLSYRFGWYLMGPYSPTLTKDYYNLADALESLNEREYQEYQLQEPIKAKLSHALPLLMPPETVLLTQDQWLELVASYDYLRRVSKETHKDAVQTLEKEKPHLVKYINQAQAILQQENFLPC